MDEKKPNYVVPDLSGFKVRRLPLWQACRHGWRSRGSVQVASAGRALPLLVDSCSSSCCRVSGSSQCHALQMRGAAAGLLLQLSHRILTRSPPLPLPPQLKAFIASSLVRPAAVAT
jgi:hypothetical protein